MKNRLYLVGGVLLVAAALGLLWWSPWESREPVYHGKPLSTWLKAYALELPSYLNAVVAQASARPFARQAPPLWAAQSDAQAVLRQTGTNALPVLLRMLRTEDSALKLKLVALAKRQRILKIEFTPAKTWNLAAQLGFSEMGERAQSAVPALIRIADRSTSSTSRSGAIRALASIGPSAREAIPLLERCATNANRSIRADAVGALSRIYTEPDQRLRMLIECLHDPDDDLRRSAAVSLGALGRDAKAGVPALVELHNESSNVTTRLIVLETLRRIDPEAAANVAVKPPPYR
jgi:HEAT repeat protein